MRGVGLGFRLLGTLAVERDGQPVDVGTPQRRTVLALLLHEVGTAVSTDRLADAVWGDDAPAATPVALQAHVSHLRRALRGATADATPLVRRGRGYSLDVDPAALDATRFRTGAARARQAVRAGDWATAQREAGEALKTWRGDYLADLADHEWVRSTAAALDEVRAGAQQDLVVALLGTGDLTGAVVASGAALAAQPYSERAAWLRAVSLHRAGRTPDALEAHRAFTALLDDDLGLRPGPELQQLHVRLLRHDPSLARWPAAAPSDTATAAPAAPAAPAPPAPPVAPAPAPAVAVPQPEPGDGGLVGRRGELAAVTAALARALEAGDPGGTTAWVALTGPAGIGKTRLAAVAAGAWQRAGGRVVRVVCPEDDAVPAWWPVRQVLAALGADPGAVLTLPAGVGPDDARFAVGDRVRAAVLEATSAERPPALVVVDDAQWADRPSLRLLALLAETVERSGLAVLVTVRDGVPSAGLDQLLAAVARHPSGRLVPLGPLTAPEVADLVEDLSGSALPDDQARALAERTGGNPFFVTEFARLSDAERARGTTPAAVRSVLHRRLLALDDDVRDLLGVASAFGDEVDPVQLAHLTGRDLLDVAALLDAATDERVLTAGTAGGLAFSHALLREELLRGLPALRRAGLHLAAAAQLEGVDQPDAVRRRAHHLREAGPLADPAQLLGAASAAARAADAAFQYDAAATWWEVAARAGAAGGADGDALDALVSARVRSLALAGDGQGVLDALDGALLEAYRAGRTRSVGVLATSLLRVSGSWPWPVYGADTATVLTTLEALAAALDDDPAAQARVLAAAAVGHHYDPDPAVPERLSARALDLARASGDPDIVVDAVLGRALAYAGVAGRARESLDLLGALPPLGGGDEVLRHNLATMAALLVGDAAGTAVHVRDGALGAEAQRMPISRVQFRWCEGALAQWHGELERAGQLYARAEAAHRSTDLQQAGTFELAHLLLHWERGTLSSADGRIPTNPAASVWTEAVVAGARGDDAALAREVARPEPVSWTTQGRLALLAHVVADRGLVALAPSLHERLTPLDGLLACFGQVGVVGPVSLALGRLALLEGRLDDALRYVDAAEATALAAGGATAALHCRVVRLEVAAEAGRPLVAAEVADALGRAEDGGLRGLASRLRALVPTAAA